MGIGSGRWSSDLRQMRFTTSRRFITPAEDPAVLRGQDLFRRSYETHVLGLVNFLEAIRATKRPTKIFYAASSHVFGEPIGEIQNEQTPLEPRGVYGITKGKRHSRLSPLSACARLQASVGILYNHESPFRRVDFLSQKIVRAAVAARRGDTSKLVLGNFAAQVDWGYAADYADAMVKIVALPEAGEFVVATGQLHTVRDFAEIAYRAVGLDYRDHVEERGGVVAKNSGAVLCGDAAKLRAATGWTPSVSFEQMIALLIAAEEERAAMPVAAPTPVRAIVVKFTDAMAREIVRAANLYRQDPTKSADRHAGCCTVADNSRSTGSTPPTPTSNDNIVAALAKHINCWSASILKADPDAHG